MTLTLWTLCNMLLETRAAGRHRIRRAQKESEGERACGRWCVQRGWSIMGLITLMFFRELISSEEGVERTGRGEEWGCWPAGDLATGHDELHCLFFCCDWRSLQMLAVISSSFLPRFLSLPFCHFPATYSIHFTGVLTFPVPSPSSSSLGCFTGTDAGHWAPIHTGCPCSRAANQIVVPELFTQVHKHTGTYRSLSLSLTHTHTHRNHTWA